MTKQQKKKIAKESTLLFDRLMVSMEGALKSLMAETTKERQHGK